MSFKICMIGCGYMAEYGHGPAYRIYADGNPEVELAGCCDIDENRASVFQQKFGFSRYYTDMLTMLDVERPDAVCLVVPPKRTADMAIAIMERGYPLLLEKPPGMNREETLRIAEAASRGNVPNQVAFNRRYMPVIDKLMEDLASDEAAAIHSIRYTMNRIGRTDKDFATTAIHGIDLVSHIAGAGYRHAHIRYQELPFVGESVANFHLSCEMASGAVALLSFNPVSGITSEGLEVSVLNRTCKIELPVSGTQTAPCETSGFYEENRRFFDDIRAGRKPQGDIMSSLQAVEIADCLRSRISQYIAVSGGGRR